MKKLVKASLITILISLGFISYTIAQTTIEISSNNSNKKWTVSYSGITDVSFVESTSKNTSFSSGTITQLTMTYSGIGSLNSVSFETTGNDKFTANSYYFWYSQDGNVAQKITTQKIANGNNGKGNDDLY